MKSKVSVAIISCLATLLFCAVLFSIFAPVFEEYLLSNVPSFPFTPQSSSGTSAKTYDRTLNSMKRYIDSYAIFDVDEEEAADSLLAGYLYGSLPDDVYAEYYSKADFESFNSSNEGSFKGFGIQMTANPDGGLFIMRVLGNSPAESAGVEAADVITTIDGEDITSMPYEESSELLRSKVEGSVQIVVKRGEETLTLGFAGEAFTERDVEWDVCDGVGFIRVHGFTAVAATQFEEALNAVLEQDVRGIVFDLRNNGGGMLSAVCYMLDLLLPKEEPIVITEYKGYETQVDSQRDPVTDLPMAVLVNESSASASELFSSSLRDILNAPLIGTTTYGKGVGQSIYDLPNGGGVKFTTFRYYTKARNDYDGIGLTPDVELPLSEDEARCLYATPLAEDRQFQKALEILFDHE